MRIIDLDKEKAEEGCLNWTASDVAYKVEHWVDMASDSGKYYDIIDEHTEEHREYLQGIMQDAIAENYDYIADKINECLWDYMIENKTDIIQTLIDNKYLKIK
jgi:hypothetical protein